MAMQSLGPLVVPRMTGDQVGSPTFTGNVLLLDAASEKAAFIFQAPKSGDIRKILWRLGTVTTGATLDIRLETVDLTTGNPTGTLWATNTNAAAIVSATDDDTMVTSTLTADATVVKGDLLAVVIVNPAVSFGNLQISGFADDDLLNIPYADLFTTVWTKPTVAPVVGVEYSDGSYANTNGCWPMSAITTTNFSAASTPDVIALRFSLPYPARITGFWIWIDLDGNATVKLYDPDGGTVLESLGIDTDVRNSAGTKLHTYLFDTSISLSKDTVYRLGIEPAGATSVQVHDFTVPTAAALDSFPGGQAFHLSTAKDPFGVESWTQTTTRQPFMGLLLDQFDDGVGAGSGGGLRLAGHGGLASGA